ncbi:MAG TPA: hypothetical protein VIH87_11495 [Methylocella sp.]
MRGDPALEIESRKIRAKFIDQQFPETGLDLVMAWFSREMAQKIYRGRSDHRSKIAAASELDNPGGRAIQSFLHSIRHRPAGMRALTGIR